MSERKFNLGQIVVTKAIDERMKSSEFCDEVINSSY